MEEMMWEASDLPIKIGATYVVLYLLLPRYFMKKRIVVFSVLFVITLIFAAFFQRLFYYSLVNPILDPGSPNEAFFQPNRILKTVFGIYPVVVLAAFIKIGKHWYERDRESQKLEKEKLEAELKFLKAQIHPHFLFNTLNNLYALTLKKSEKASEVVLKLSHLLDYLLYDCNEWKVAVDKELELIETYISLEKIRYGDRLDISYTIEGNTSGKEIPPMLILPFVENSFKHGTSQQLEQVWLRIDVVVQEDSLLLHVANSKNALSNQNDDQGVKEGIGLKNVKRRLDLLFDNSYTLNIADREDSFQVDLSLKLNQVFKSKQS